MLRKVLQEWKEGIWLGKPETVDLGRRKKENISLRASEGKPSSSNFMHLSLSIENVGIAVLEDNTTLGINMLVEGRWRKKLFGTCR